MTGKGLHSRGNRSILKPAAAEWSRLRDFDYEEE
jgi:DNA-nicking Smr family endonuclease